MNIPLLAGEVCRRPPDSQGTVQDVMVNRSLAERYFPTRSPVGVRVSAMPFLPSGRITGVVGDARELGVDREPVPTVYTCFSAPIATPWFLVSTRDDSAAALRTIRARLAEIEPLRAVYDITTLEQRISGAYAQNRLRTVLLVLFSATALALTCLGVYGTLSYMVGLRRREVGLRMALGAMSRNIVRHFLFKALRVVGLACALGLALSLAFTRVLSGMLYGVSPSDPATLSAVIVLVLLVSAFAALFPALRASRAEPMSALRQD
ncbi:MAG TPA: FtsX-like permease family protein [Gammaproteobacteria bacterium]